MVWNCSFWALVSGSRLGYGRSSIVVHYHRKCIAIFGVNIFQNVHYMV